MIVTGIILFVLAVAIIGAVQTGWEPDFGSGKEQDPCETILFGEC